jgi:hypothetical protein
MRKTVSTVAAGLALSLALTSPASAGFTEVARTFNVCGGANFALCASVQVSVMYNGPLAETGYVTMTVSNFSQLAGGPAGDVFNTIGVNAGGGIFQANNLNVPRGWTALSHLDPSSDFGVRSFSPLYDLGLGSGTVTFSFTLRGDFSNFDITGTNLVINGNPAVIQGDIGDGGDPGGIGGGGDGGPITQTPEPGTLILLGTGMAGIAGMRRRRRERNE